MKAIHEKKNQDYAAKGKEFENFERVADLISWFDKDIDKAFVGLITVKLARLATLLNSGSEPNNESIDDSFLDLCTYAVLWTSYHKSHPVKSDGKVTITQNICTHPTTHRNSLGFDYCDICHIRVNSLA